MPDDDVDVGWMRAGPRLEYIYNDAFIITSMPAKINTIDYCGCLANNNYIEQRTFLIFNNNKSIK